jgi:UDP-N-acetylmuramyl pentapeptide phosphotransferase/UDP-N-acetylglucosamine-1-phosphate transferase
MEEKKKPRKRRSLAGKFGGLLIIFGIIIFTCAWWVPDNKVNSAFYIIGFITVILGVVAPAALSRLD